MRIITLILPVCLLTLTAAAPVANPAVDPNNDFDCATAYKYAYRMSVAKQRARHSGTDIADEQMVHRRNR